MLISYAQNFEDVLLARVFSNLERGFYVDIGAFDPVAGSVTKALYDRGWNGINIESGAGFQRLVEGRPRDINLNIAIRDRRGTVKFVENASDPGASHVEALVAGEHAGADTRTYSVSCDRLDHVLAEHAAGRVINLIKIDTEGSENEIIHSTDWTKIRPQVLLIEAVEPRTNTLISQAWEDKLTASGYKRAYFDGVNLFFVRDEDADLLRHFDRPVNERDWFVKHDPVKEKALASIRRFNWELATRFHKIHRRHHDPPDEREAGELEKLLLDGMQKPEQLLQQLSAILVRFDWLVDELDRVLRRRRTLHDEHDAARLNVRSNTAAFSQPEKLLLELEAAIDAAIRCDRIVGQFKDPGGPRALRMVLPLGRLIGATMNLVAGSPETVKPTSAKWQWGRNARGHEVTTKLGHALYRVVRAIVRPPAERLRDFILEPIRPVVGQVDAMAREVEVIRRALANEQIRSELSPELIRSIEALLLTMALSDARK